MRFLPPPVQNMLLIRKEIVTNAWQLLWGDEGWGTWATWFWGEFSHPPAHAFTSTKMKPCTRNGKSLVCFTAFIQNRSLILFRYYLLSTPIIIAVVAGLIPLISRSTLPTVPHHKGEKWMTMVFLCFTDVLPVHSIACCNPAYCQRGSTDYKNYARKAGVWQLKWKL